MLPDRNDGKPILPLLDADDFSTTVDGKPVALYTLESGNGIYAQITNYGARVVSLLTPDRNSNYEDITLGFEKIDHYLDNKGERVSGAGCGALCQPYSKWQVFLGWNGI